MFVTKITKLQNMKEVYTVLCLYLNFFHREIAKENLQYDFFQCKLFEQNKISALNRALELRFGSKVLSSVLLFKVIIRDSWHD